MEILWGIISIIISLIVASSILQWDKKIKENKKIDPITRFIVRIILWSTAIVGTLLIMMFISLLKGRSKKS